MVEKIASLKNPGERCDRARRFGLGFVRAGGYFEVLVILGIWLLLFSDTSILGGFTREEMVAYILIGNIIGFMVSYLWARTIAEDLRGDDSKLLLYKPIKYFGYILSRSFSKFILSFVFLITANLVLLYILAGEISTGDIRTLGVIFVMVILAFIIEFLIAYLLNIFVFWTFEASDFYKVLNRFKKVLAGAYFPLTLLPPLFVSISLYLPFAYSFFVPTQLYLKHMEMVDGLKGIVVQIFWVVVLYIIIRLSWQLKNKKQQKIKTF